jgi:hypothetical protein
MSRKTIYHTSADQKVRVHQADIEYTGGGANITQGSQNQREYFMTNLLHSIITQISLASHNTVLKTTTTNPHHPPPPPPPPPTPPTPPPPPPGAGAGCTETINSNVLILKLQKTRVV